MTGLVVKKNARIFSVISQGKLFELEASGKTKENGIFVGDKVEFDGAINAVLPRKNLLIRPPIANLDKLFIVLSPLPKPDFVLVDKIITYCFVYEIQPIIVINKTDIATDDFLQGIEQDYNFLKIIKTSAKNGEISCLKDEIEGICAFAGQSAVGKSSIVNAIFGDGTSDVGELSKKIERGKQTTRIVSLFQTEKGYIADTAGFSMLDLNFVAKLEPRELSYYYPDFLEGRALCKYRQCLHEGGECGVIKLVREGKISKRRYENYLKILTELKNSKKIY